MVDGVLILGKELRRDPARALRELRARSAAASALIRAGAPWVGNLEAHLDGQSMSGATLVTELLLELGVPRERIVTRDITCSTREEAWLGAALFSERGSRSGVVLTASYHVARSARLFREALAPAVVRAPGAFLALANDKERAWIEEGEPGPEALAAEGRTERLWGLAERLLAPLPVGLATQIEVAAGRAWRG